MRITSLRVENIKRIKLIDITPNKNAVIIEGKNAQGKTSLLDSFAMALGGKSLIPANPIRNGQETAEIKIDLGDYTVTRTWSKSGATKLKLENKDGMSASSPQKMLDALVGDLSFDPMAFCNMDKAKRVTMLKDIAGLDFTKLESEYRDKYDDRRLANRGIKELQIKVDGFGECEDPGDIPTANELDLKLINANDFNKKINEAGGKAKNCERYITSSVDEISKKRDMIVSLQADIDKMEKANKEFYVDAENYRCTAKEELMDTDEIEKQLNDISEMEKQKDTFNRKNQMQNQLVEATGQATLLSDRLQEIEDTKNKLVSEAKLPVKGLDFLNGDVSYNGIEFEQASTAEQIKVSMAIAMALNPKIKIVRIMNGSLLDSDTMAEIVKIAEKMDYQIWVECVSDTKSNNAVFIEDGEVVN